MRWLPVSAACLALAACASGGGGGSAPAPAPPTYTSLSNPAASQDFASHAAGGAAVRNSATNLVQSESAGLESLTVHYDLTAHGYTFTAPGGRAQTFLPADVTSSGIDKETATKTSGAITDTVTLDYPAAGVGKTPYAALGVWERDTASGGSTSVTYDAFAFGSPSPASEVPRTGQAAYNIVLSGYLTAPALAPRTLRSSGGFNVDFAKGAFSLAATASEAGPGLTQGLSGSLNASGQLSSADGSFSGQFAYQNGTSLFNVSGAVNGRFYGPAAEQVGGAFAGGNAAGAALAGAFAGYASQGGGPTVDPTPVYTTQTYRPSDALLFTIPDSPPYASTNTLVGTLTFNSDGSVYFSPGQSNLAGITFTAANRIASARPNFDTYQAAAPNMGYPIGGGQTTQLSVYKSGSANSELALSYTGLGAWQEPNTIASGDLTQAFFTYGLATPASTIQGMTGTAVYRGVVYGAAADQTTRTHYDITGTSQFTADFSAATVAASLSMTGTPVGGGATHGYALNVSAPISGANATANIPGSVAIGGGGSIQMQFYGPGAEEIGARFTYNVQDSQTGNAVAISGAAVAKR